MSFIIPYLNNPEPTSKCLLELFRTARETASAEYVLVSDGSDNETLVLETINRLKSLFGVRIIHHHFDKRSGFGLSVNKGGELSSGEYYAIINNDAYVVKVCVMGSLAWNGVCCMYYSCMCFPVPYTSLTHPRHNHHHPHPSSPFSQGWLWALLSTFSQRNPRRAGLVGPMFLGRNNLVQEGGGWMFTDATGGNYGKGKPLATKVNYLREVDYVSAAAVVTPADLQDPFGILDDSYENGYYEDTDLAFR